MKKYSIGIDIGGTKCAVILGKALIPTEGLEGFILDRVCFKTETWEGPDFVIGNICDAVVHMMNKHKIDKEEVVGIGISCGGPLDHIKGVVLNPPNLYGWNNIPMVDIIENKFQIPTYLQNDANACALAEWRFGAAKGKKNVIFLTCGTGLGAGLILDGRLYSGTNNMAGEVGHIRLDNWGPVGFGKQGSFEGFCSGGGIAQIGKLKVLEKLQVGIRPDLCPDYESLSTLTAKSIAMAAKQGDKLAIEIYAVSGHYLGVGISLLIDILNPEIIVLGSIYERSEKLLWDSVKEVIDQEALPMAKDCCQVVPAKLGDQIGDYAALSVAIQGVEQYE